MAKDPAIKKKALELFAQFDSDPFPALKGKCVYGVFLKTAVYVGSFHLVYIGSTSDLEKRRNNHLHPYRICLERFPCKIVCVMDFKSENNIEDEKILISHFKPIFNKQHV